MVNSPLIRPYLLGGGTLDSHESTQCLVQRFDFHVIVDTALSSSMGTSVCFFFFGGGNIQKDTTLKTHMEPPKIDGEEGSFLFHLFGSMLGFLGKQFIMPIVI